MTAPANWPASLVAAEIARAEAYTRGQTVGHRAALAACAETHDEVWWAGWCWAAVPWFGAGVVFALMIGRVW